MLIKKGKVKIMNVIDDDDHNLDDEGTRKVLDKAAQELKNVDSTETLVKPEKLEN